MIATEDFVYSLADDEEITFVIGGFDFAYAPVRAGDDAGNLFICVQGKTAGKVPLVYGGSVEQLRSVEKSFWRRLIGGS